jgi:hypothetical protein
MRFLEKERIEARNRISSKKRMIMRYREELHLYSYPEKCIQKKFTQEQKRNLSSEWLRKKGNFRSKVQQRKR